MLFPPVVLNGPRLYQSGPYVNTQFLLLAVSAQGRCMEDAVMFASCYESLPKTSHVAPCTGRPVPPWCRTPPP
ncbi:hypothetical protein QE327_gp073 [Pseudomonas phage Henu5]|uniref:Uncharacterized protein n=1 Tax=Pseudomonas phage Henu5 TaxID=2499902 RepID=A0A410T835_9CAUD|nr:hypothetical protein QE327_gp073 [Pseudomonas phage Henu5]QAU05106.1 hypothetical protein Henu5_gp77 [Pseudomonas phage Henu5]